MHSRLLLRALCAACALLALATSRSRALGAPTSDASSVETTATSTAARSIGGGFPAAEDPALRQLVDDALARRPELRRVEALIRAERERVVRARALPDPSITFGIQNDGFTSIEIGRMETSFVSIMAAQTFPWPGKRDLREDLARFGVDLATIELERARLTTEADVRRAFVALLLTRSRLTLLDELAILWTQSEQAAKARYEAGEAAQSDLLRAQLERARLEKRRWILLAEERASIQELNRLRALSPDTAIATPATLEALPDPEPGDLAVEYEQAFAASPELAASRLAVARAEKATAIAEKDLFPDIGVSLGVMPRGDLPPMWQANLSFTLPVFAGSKQSRAIAERRALRESEARSVEGVELTLRQAIESRAIALRALLDAAALYRKGLLVQARATAESTLAQYRVGRVAFASVLEAVAGYIADRDELLSTLADAQRIAIARDELSLAPSTVGGGAFTSGAMPGAGSMGSAPRSSASTAASQEPAADRGGSSMGGM